MECFRGAEIEALSVFAARASASLPGPSAFDLGVEKDAELGRRVSTESTFSSMAKRDEQHLEVLWLDSLAVELLLAMILKL